MTKHRLRQYFKLMIFGHIRKIRKFNIYFQRFECFFVSNHVIILDSRIYKNTKSDVGVFEINFGRQKQLALRSFLMDCT